MKKSRFLCLILSVVMLVAMLPSASIAANTETSKPTIFIIGDSMAASYEEAKYPRMGWGQAMPNFFTDEVVFDNRAVAGTSSRSFYNVYWSDIVANMKEGDYLLFTFGANDSKKDQEVSSEDGTDADLTSDEKLKLRNTDPTLPADSETGIVDGETKYSFKYFMNKYITETKAMGATPIMLTPPERRDNRSVSNLQFAVDTMGLYDDAIIELAEELNEDNDETNDVLCLSDVGASSLALYKDFGDEASKKLFCYLNDGQYETEYWENDDGTTTAADGTHFRDFGAAEIAGIIVEELIQNDSDLVKYIKTVSTPLVYDRDHNTVGIGFKKRDSLAGKNTPLYPRAQFVNKENKDTSIQVVTARYSVDGRLEQIVSNDEVSVPAQSVISFDTNCTMPSKTEPGQIKMFVWKDYDSLLPHGNNLQKWTFTAGATSDYPVFEETFDDLSTLGWSNANDAAPYVGVYNGSECFVIDGANSPSKEPLTYTSIGTITFTEGWETVLELDIKLGQYSYFGLRGGSKDAVTCASGGEGSTLTWWTYDQTGGSKGTGANVYTEIEGATAETLIHFKAVIDEGAQTADVYINGGTTPVLNDVGIHAMRYNENSDTTDDISAFTRFYVKQYKSKVSTPTYLDNISIYRQKISE